MRVESGEFNGGNFVSMNHRMGRVRWRWAKLDKVLRSESVERGKDVGGTVDWSEKEIEILKMVGGYLRRMTASV